MLKRLLMIVVVLLMCFPAGETKAAEFQPLGYQAISMGGAGVASARGSFAAYYNPALLAVSRHGGEVTLSPGVGAREINLVDHIDELAKIDIQKTFNDLAALEYVVDGSGNVTINGDTTEIQANFSTMQTELKALSHKNGLQLMPNLSFGVQVKNIGVGVYGLAEATAFAVVDENRLDVVVQENSVDEHYIKYDVPNDTASLVDRDVYEATSIEYAVSSSPDKDPSTYMNLTGIGYVEVPFAYGHQINSPLGRLCVGGSFKIMSGNTYEAVIDIDTASEDISDAVRDSEKKDTTWGLDLGLLYSPPNMNQLAFGLVGKNLNKPDFDTRLGTNLDVDPQVRAGVAWNLLNDKITLALDMDMTVNESFIANYDTRYVGGGISYHPFSWLSVRGGVMENLEESEEGTILTGGLGFGTKWIQLDLSGQCSTESGEFEGEEIPRYVRAQLAFVSKWD